MTGTILIVAGALVSMATPHSYQRAQRHRLPSEAPENPTSTNSAAKPSEAPGNPDPTTTEPEEIEAMYRLLAIAKYEHRCVIRPAPEPRRELD